MAPCAWESNKSYSFLLHPNLCLCFYSAPETESRFWQQPRDLKVDSGCCLSCPRSVSATPTVAGPTSRVQALPSTVLRGARRCHWETCAWPSTAAPATQSASMSLEQARVAAPALLEHAGHWRCWETWEQALVITPAVPGVGGLPLRLGGLGAEANHCCHCPGDA